MDEILVRLMEAGKKGQETELAVLDLEGTVGVGRGKVRHVLKPLRDLYATKANPTEMDPTSEEYMPLFMGIETAILSAWEMMPELTDGQVLLALEKLAQSPEGAVGEDVLGKHVQFTLRLQLSLRDYSRKEVQRALRKIGQSVERHRRTGGQRGYLEFIREFMP